jgi:predicted lipoprotein with Yx(FWY)xxD motif
MSVGAGLDATKFSTVPRTDGGMQVRIDKWPLYRFGGDVAAGQTNGQGLLGKWYVVSPAGQAIK